MRKRIALLIVCLSIGLAGSAFAQAPATFVFKSGERLSADLLDLGCCDYTISVNGQERKVGLNDLAVIDFTGGGQNFPANEVSKILPGQNLLVMRDGQMLAGKFTDVGGIRPKRITFMINGQTRDFTSDQVARIYLEAPPSATGTSGTAQAAPSAAGGPKSVRVPANQAWTNTGVSVQKGQLVNFSSSGDVKLSPEASDTAQVAGRGEHRLGERATLPGLPGGALIGRIGNGHPFGIGNQTSITMPESGELYLGVDDDYFDDNSGEYTVVVTPQGGTAGTSGAAVGQAREVRVPANRAWTNAGLAVRNGQTVAFSTTGEVKLSNDPSDVAQAAGRPEHGLGSRATLPGVPGGALIGRIGNGRPFAIGNQTSIVMPGTGQLYLGVDDDLFTDNSGEFLVTISPQGGSAVGR